MDQQAVEHILAGNRIPGDYFIARGTGESDLSVHAGSFHLALHDAGISMKNLMVYTSVLPATAREVPPPEHMTMGAVMECIMAVAHGKKGERVTAGLITGWLHEPEGDQRVCGLVAELGGNYAVGEMESLLKESLHELHTHGYQHYKMGETRIITESFVPGKKHGTALTALCFVNYRHPLIRKI